MKKTYILFVLILFGTVQISYAQKKGFRDFIGNHSGGTPTYPIPSYSTPVMNYANFTEQMQSAPGQGDNSEKRDIEVSNDTPTYYPSLDQAIVFVYRLDYSKIQGPYLLPQNGSITIRVDQKAWGVVVYSPYVANFSVWVNANGQPNPLP
jgi:hypothetical protein